MSPEVLPGPAFVSRGHVAPERSRAADGPHQATRPENIPGSDTTTGRDVTADTPTGAGSVAFGSGPQPVVLRRRIRGRHLPEGLRSSRQSGVGDVELLRRVLAGLRRLS